MKKRFYPTLYINQAGVNNSDLVEYTDLVDWAMIGYLKFMYELNKNGVVSKTVEGGEFTWIKYSRLIDELPLIGITRIESISRRFNKLRRLGLIETDESKNREAWYRTTEMARDVLDFRVNTDNEFERLKFSIRINQAGIVKSGLLEHTDLVDWAMIDYLLGWQQCVNRKVKRIKFQDQIFTRVNYNYLISQLPIIKIETKRSLIYRFAKLRNLKLLETRQAPENTLYFRLTDIAVNCQNYSTGRKT